MKRRNFDGPVNVRFTVPSFRYKGVEYNSAALEKAAEEGDENAQFIIANLVKIGSGIVIASEIDEADVDVEQAQQTESMHTQELARKDAIIAELNESLTEALRALAVKTEEMNNALASKDDELAEKDSIIAQLKSGSATQTNPA
jgi:hypothetical protein